MQRSEEAAAGAVGGADGDTGAGDGAAGTGDGGETGGAVTGSDIDHAVCGVEEVRMLGSAGNNHFEMTKRMVIDCRRRRLVSTTLPDARST